MLPASNGSSSLIELGYVDSRQTTIAQAPHHLVLDRLLVTIPATQAQRRGIALNSASTQVLGCHLAGLKFAGADSQAIAGWNGPGPFVIENNYLEGAGENLMFGGSDPTIPGLVPTGIQIRRNHFSKPIAWKGSSWTVKNILELKNAQDVVIEANLLEYNWLAAQQGYSVLFTPRNQYGGNNDTVVQRVKFVNNKVRHVSSVFNILGRDNNFPSQLTNDIEIRNNVFEDVSKAAYGGSGRMLLIDGGDNIRVINNTSLNAGTAIYATGHAVTGFLLENNIFDYGDFGIMGDGASPGKGTLTTWFPGSVVLGNVIPDNTQPWTFPVGNSYPVNWAAVGLVDLAGGNYRLAPTSAYIAAGTGGTTPGADVDALETALSGGPPIPPACTFSVAPSSHDSPAGGDTFSVAVTASDASCAWSASAAPWITPSPTGGRGSGTVVLTVSPNATTAPRSASVMVADSAVAVTQAPVCAFTLAPSSHDSPAGGDTFSVGVTASDASCAWSVSAAPWVTPSPTGGTGSGTVVLTVSPNATTAPRSASVMVADSAVAVTQAPVCAFTLAPSSHDSPAGGDTFSVGVTASDASCAWSVSAAPWVTPSPTGGTGSGTVVLTVSPNATTAPRSASVMVADSAVAVTQAPVCAFTLAPSSHDSPAGGDTFSVAVTASHASCAWSVSAAPWITPSATGGTGSGTVALTVSPNATTAPRSASVMVADSAVAVTQAAPDVAPVCAFTLAPSSHDSPAGGDTFSVAVTASHASCAWSVSAAPWITPSATGGTGSGTVVLTVSPNATTAPRSASVMIAGSAVAVTQAAPDVAPVCAFTLSPSNVKVLAGGTTFAATLTASAPSCGWIASANAGWVSLSSTSGAGTATLSVTVAATTTNGARSATITAGGKTLAVQQSGLRKK